MPVTALNSFFLGAFVGLVLGGWVAARVTHDWDVCRQSHSALVCSVKAW
jgi:hypothetical protein